LNEFSALSAEEALRVLPKVWLVLDFHGVTDLFPADHTFTSQPGVVTFVGYGTPTHKALLVKLQERILSGQISYAVVCFVRGQRGPMINGEKPENSFSDPGSKAWIIQNLPLEKKSIFIDDGVDHVKSANSLSIPGLTCVLVSGKKMDEVSKKIKEFGKKIL
jgi:hypothetical protein